jgi:serine protease Do
MRIGNLLHALGCVTVAILFSTAWIATTPAQTPDPKEKKRHRAVSPDEAATMSTADKVSPALVTIQPVVERASGGRKRKGTGTGSGVIIDAEGHILTNYHVAGDAKKLIVTLSSQERVDAELVGADPYTDLAVIKLKLEELKTRTLSWASLGDSDEIEVGQTVLALGSPLGLKRTVTKGIVSNHRRYFSGNFRLPTGQKTGEYNNWIQFDAAANPGNSGGPVVNNRGEVVGVVARGVPGRTGLGFAIPINTAKRIARTLIDHGKVTRSWIGADFQPMDGLRAMLHVDEDAGVLLASVTREGPAWKGGLRAGDVVVGLNGRPVNVSFKQDLPELRNRIAELKPGAKAAVRVLRDSKELTFEVVTEELEPFVGEEKEFKEWRMTARAMTKPMALDRKLSVPTGALVSGCHKSGVAHRAKLYVGDIIVAFEGKPVGSLEAFESLYRKSVERKARRVLLTVRRGRALNYVLIKPEYEEEE